MDKVRAILREADQHSSFQQRTWSRPKILPLFAGYAAWNLAATAYDYRVVGNEAVAQLAKTDGLGEVTVSLHLSTGALHADLSSSVREFAAAGPEVNLSIAEGDEDADAEGADASPRRRVRVMPHLYLSDLIFGRSRWKLTCRKANGRTAYFTGPADGADSTEGSSRFDTQWSSRSGWERR